MIDGCTLLLFKLQIQLVGLTVWFRLRDWHLHCDFVIIQLVGPDLSVFYNNLGQSYGTWRKDLNILGLFC